jgi:hypothetical protein
MLHLNAGVWLHPDCDEACQGDSNKRKEIDRTYACEALCFGKSSGSGEATKCSCDRCLGTPEDQKCNERCQALGTCHDPKEEERCTFPTKPDKIYCHCNKKCYDKATDCTSECKASLGCFTGICAPTEPGQCPAMI